MTIMSNSEFAEHMMLLAKSAPPFKPMATYDPDGDCIEFLAKPDPFYAERIDDLVTVYYSLETGEIAGLLIKDIRGLLNQILKDTPGFKTEIKDGRTRLVHLLRNRLWVSPIKPNGNKANIYRELISVTEESQVETDLCAV